MQLAPVLHTQKRGFNGHRFCPCGTVSHHCLYTWNFHILHLELKTTLPFFAVSFVSRMHISNHSALLRQKGLSLLFLGTVNFFQESEISIFSNYLLAQPVLVILGKRCQESSLDSFFCVTSSETALNASVQSFLTNC